MLQLRCHNDKEMNSSSLQVLGRPEPKKEAGPGIAAGARIVALIHWWALLIPRVDRPAAPVEPPNQLAAHGLHGWMDALGRARADGNHAAGADERDVRAAVVSEAVLGLPEQPREPAELVFRAATDEEAIVGLRRGRQGCARGRCDGETGL